MYYGFTLNVDQIGKILLVTKNMSFEYLLILRNELLVLIKFKKRILSMLFCTWNEKVTFFTAKFRSPRKILHHILMFVSMTVVRWSETVIYIQIDYTWASQSSSTVLQWVGYSRVSHWILQYSVIFVFHAFSSICLK